MSEPGDSDVDLRSASDRKENDEQLMARRSFGLATHSSPRDFNLPCLLHLSFCFSFFFHYRLMNMPLQMIQTAKLPSSKREV